MKQDLERLPTRLEAGGVCIPAQDWGTVLRGSIHVRFADGSEETVRAGQVYYWPPGRPATRSGSTRTTSPSSSAPARRWAS